MGCDPLRDADGNVVGFVCSRTESKRCSSCGSYTRQPRLCDEPLTGSKTGKTCDRVLCASCAVRVGPNRDLCPTHARQVAKGA